MSIVRFTTQLLPSCWALYVKTSSYVCRGGPVVLGLSQCCLD